MLYRHENISWANGATCEGPSGRLIVAHRARTRATISSGPRKVHGRYRVFQPVPNVWAIASGMMLPQYATRSMMGRTRLGGIGDDRVWLGYDDHGLSSLDAGHDAIDDGVDVDELEDAFWLPPHSVRPAGSAATSSIIGVVKNIGWTVSVSRSNRARWHLTPAAPGRWLGRGRRLIL